MSVLKRKTVFKRMQRVARVETIDCKKWKQTSEDEEARLWCSEEQLGAVTIVSICCKKWKHVLCMHESSFKIIIFFYVIKKMLI